MGVLAVGGIGIGVLTFGGLGVALFFAYSAVAVAPVAFGGVAIGYYALGGFTFGVHAWGGNANDPMARELVYQLRINQLLFWTLALTAASFAVSFGGTAWARRKGGGKQSAPGEALRGK